MPCFLFRRDFGALQTGTFTAQGHVVGGLMRAIGWRGWMKWYSRVFTQTSCVVVFFVQIIVCLFSVPSFPILVAMLLHATNDVSTSVQLGTPHRFDCESCCGASSASRESEKWAPWKHPNDVLLQNRGVAGCVTTIIYRRTRSQ